MGGAEERGMEITIYIYILKEVRNRYKTEDFLSFEKIIYVGNKKEYDIKEMLFFFDKDNTSHFLKSNKKDSL